MAVLFSLKPTASHLFDKNSRKTSNYINIFTPSFWDSPTEEASTSNINTPPKESLNKNEEKKAPQESLNQLAQLSPLTTKLNSNLQSLKSTLNTIKSFEENPLASNSPLIENFKHGEIIVSEDQSSPYFDFLVRVARRVFFATISQLSSNPSLVQDTSFKVTVFIKKSSWDLSQVKTPNAITTILMDIVKVYAEDPNPPSLIFEKSFNPKIEFNFEIQKLSGQGFKMILKSKLKL